MPYERPRSSRPITKSEKLLLLKEYAREYESIAKSDPSALNRKISREAFGEVLDAIGAPLNEKASSLAGSPGPVRDFLDSNPVPGKTAQFLPDSVRAFCLALNALKQWVVAEQAAMDRFLLGSQARELCRAAFDHCLITSEELGAGLDSIIPCAMGARRYR